MFSYRYDDFLKEYERELNEISIKSLYYKQFLQSAVEKFFGKIEKKYLEYYFINFDKKNVFTSQIQENAFTYLMKLTVQKYRRPSDFINKVFPDYVESELTPKSAWLIIRLFHVFISWFIKPKLNLKNFSDAKKMLFAVRRVQEGRDKMDDEEFNNALDIIVIKFLHGEKIVSPSYIPINKTNLSEEWEAYKNNPSHQFHCLDMDNLLHCLTSRISSLENSEEKNYLFCVLPALKDFVYKKDLLSFREKYQEIFDFLKKNTGNKNLEITQSIKNISLKIIQRFYILNKKFLANENIYLPNNLIKEKIEKMKFYYEAYRANWEKYYVVKATTANYYEILNSLENVLYDVSFIRDISGVAGNINIHQCIEILQRLKNFSENVILKNLSEDMISLSELISHEMSFLQPEAIEEYNQIRLYDSAESDEEWDEEWDDASDISESPNVVQLEQEQDLNRDEFITNTDNQSDSGISDEEENNLDHHTRSTQLPTTTPFWQASFNRPKEQFVIASAEGARQSMDGHAHYIRSP
ncbi:hypothetical protein [Rickettsiella endosymbiont of Miltochrista miniata]|uniref:hypothetical protein n=1 Tax=Rickettsiella endosymbiont of Miltochrista miniata TaxID=3066239 RepID=UPI00313BAA6E